MITSPPSDNPLVKSNNSATPNLSPLSVKSVRSINSIHPNYTTPDRKIREEDENSLSGKPVDHVSRKSTISTPKSMMSRLRNYLVPFRLFRRNKRTRSQLKSSIILSHDNNDVNHDMPSNNVLMLLNPDIQPSCTQEFSTMASPQSIEYISPRFTPHDINHTSNNMTNEISSDHGIICDISPLIKNIEASLLSDSKELDVSVTWLLPYEDGYTTNAIHCTYPIILEYITRKMIHQLSSTWKQFKVFISFRCDKDIIHSSRALAERYQEKHGIKGRLCVTIRYSHLRSQKNVELQPISDMMSYDEMLREFVSTSIVDVNNTSNMMISSLLDMVRGGGRMIKFEASSTASFKDTSINYFEMTGLASDNHDNNHNILLACATEYDSQEFWVPSIMMRLK